MTHYVTKCWIVISSLTQSVQGDLNGLPGQSLWIFLPINKVLIYICQKCFTDQLSNLFWFAGIVTDNPVTVKNINKPSSGKSSLTGIGQCLLSEELANAFSQRNWPTKLWSKRWLWQWTTLLPHLKSRCINYFTLHWKCQMKVNYICIRLQIHPFIYIHASYWYCLKFVHVIG